VEIHTRHGDHIALFYCFRQEMDKYERTDLLQHIMWNYICLDTNESQVLLKQKQSINYNLYFTILVLIFLFKNKLSTIAENIYQYGIFLLQD